MKTQKEKGKIKYKKLTFNLPFGGYGTFVQKIIIIDGEEHILSQKDFPVSQNPNFYDDVTAKDLYKGNYEIT